MPADGGRQDNCVLARIARAPHQPCMRGARGIRRQRRAVDRPRDALHDLATGVKGEQWAFGQEAFDTYEPAPDRPGYYTKRQDATVEVFQLAYPIEIRRPDWKHEGVAGDWFVLRAPDDQYIVRADVFAETYEPVFETEND